MFRIRLRGPEAFTHRGNFRMGFATCNKRNNDPLLSAMIAQRCACNTDVRERATGGRRKDPVRRSSACCYVTCSNFDPPKQRLNGKRKIRCAAILLSSSFARCKHPTQLMAWSADVHSLRLRSSVVAGIYTASQLVKFPTVQPKQLYFLQI